MRTLLVGLALLLPVGATAQSTIVLDGTVPTDAATHFFVPFEVSAGIVEVEVAHDDLSAANILDFGLEDPNGFRGWGGGNTEPAVVGLTAASRSYVPGPIPAGTWRVVVGKAKLTELPASYHIVVTLRTVGTLAAQPERMPYVDPGALATGRRFYAGDFHVHSRESGDAAPTLDEIATLARAQGLDFVTISDHNTHTALDFFVSAQSRSSDVLFVPGVEFTTYAGHANGIGARTWVNHRIGVEGVTIEDAVAAYHAQGALFALNHPSLDIGDQCIGCAWEHALPASSIDAIEIATTSSLVTRLGFVEASIARWDALCDEGRHVVPIGGSDDHRAGEGSGALDSPVGAPTTMVEADELSVSGILEGLRRGRTVVRITGPEAPMILLDTHAPLDGDTVHARRTTLDVAVTGGVGHALLLFRDGALLEEVQITEDSFHHAIRIEAPANGEARYRAQVHDRYGPVAVTSHVYITRPASGGGGCAVTAPSPVACSALLAAALALALARRSTRRVR